MGLMHMSIHTLTCGYEAGVGSIEACRALHELLGASSVPSDGTLEALLVTTRETHRWSYPRAGCRRGFALKKRRNASHWKKPGWRAVIDPKPLRSFTYLKRFNPKRAS